MPSRAASSRAKRILDVSLAACLLLAAAPLMAVAAVVVWCALGRPVLFRQQRPGLYGRPYWLLKFRTMREGGASDAERLTATGNFLRRWSIDELPQLWNILRGEMSLVGPRPLLMKYLERYSPEQARRLEVRPGLTGWAQIHGRNGASWEEKFARDVWYVDHWSLGLDLQILRRTFLKVLRGEGISSSGHATCEEFLGTAASASTGGDGVEQGVIVLGAGGHAKVVVAALQAMGEQVAVVLDDQPGRWGSRLLDVPVTGPLAKASEYPGHRAVIAIGDNMVRKRLAGTYPLQWIRVVHPSAQVHASVRLGAGTVICAGAIVQPDAVIGDHVIVNTSATVDHDGHVGDFAHLAPGIHLAGQVTVGEGALLGIGSRVVPGVKVGRWSVVGAGATVLKDIPEHVLAVGVPARPVRSFPRQRMAA